MYKLNLKKVCRSRNVTLTELARRTSIPQPSLSRYESGRSDITLRQLSRISLALGAAFDEFVEDVSLTSEMKRVIARMRTNKAGADKQWVTRLLADLQEHYSKVKR